MTDSIGQGLHTSVATCAHRHQPRPARIRRGMCTSSKRRWLMTCSISQVLHASTLACAHQLGDIDRGLGA
ncbi:hypothetical protein H5410_014680 [Solanum commersonii]|uniref:Uncharacterized protein n=1 Tax=Solanum commersonii TaxID=4109 RepID=A0A9J5ZRP9_SOLCO|nr:hypothetical protein H5410_014680 [Solanum commersonii]